MSATFSRAVVSVNSTRPSQLSECRPWNLFTRAGSRCRSSIADETQATRGA